MSPYLPAELRPEPAALPCSREGSPANPVWNSAPQRSNLRQVLLLLQAPPLRRLAQRPNCHSKVQQIVMQVSLTTCVQDLQAFRSCSSRVRRSRIDLACYEYFSGSSPLQPSMRRHEERKYPAYALEAGVRIGWSTPREQCTGKRFFLARGAQRNIGQSCNRNDKEHIGPQINGSPQDGDFRIGLCFRHKFHLQQPKISDPRTKKTIKGTQFDLKLDYRRGAKTIR